MGLSAILEIVSNLVRGALALWKKKNNPSVAERSDKIDQDYDAKRRDLDSR